MRKPLYVFCDPDLIKQITIKDFEYFTDHSDFLANVDPFFAKMLPFMKGKKWKETRSVVSPVFTSSKMKGMMETLSKNAQDFTQYFEDELKKGRKMIINGKEVFSKFTVNGISNCVFGMTTDSLRNATTNSIEKQWHF